MRIAGVTVRSGSESAKPIWLPYRAEAPANATFEYSFTARKGRFTERNVVFIPDDVLTNLSVNGKPVPLAAVDPKRLEDTIGGFSFPIGDYLQPGDNIVIVRVLNRGGPTGLDVHAERRAVGRVLGFLLGAVALVWLVVIVLRALRWQWAVIVPFAVGVSLRLAYWFVTPFSRRAQDMEGHVDYIQYLLTRHSIPRASEGWSFYQPPLYYLTGAAVWGPMHALGASRTAIMFALQAQCLFYQLVFLAFSVKTVELWMDSVPGAWDGGWLRGRAALCTALLCLWPSGIIHAVRIGNDDLLYLCAGASAYFASRWWVRGRNVDLHLSGLCGALGMMTKSNGLLLFVFLAILVVARFARDPERRVGAYVRRVWPTLVLFVAATAGSLGQAILDTARGRRANVLVGNANRLSDTLAVGNHAVNYLWFDTKMFVTQPFLSSYDDSQGRQFFWNSTLKTSLFGLFGFEDARLVDLAVILSALFLATVALIVLGISNAARESRYPALPPIVLLATLVLGLAGLRISVPMACSCDFRYIFPAIVPFIYLYVWALAQFRELGRTGMSRAGAVVGWSLVASSAAFFGLLVAVD